MALLISSGGQNLLCLADTFHHMIHLEHPDWATAIDFDRRQVTATRRKLLSQAAGDGTLVFATHMTFPGLGHVVPRGDAWQWQPLAVAAT
jgi:glyoxylase-like metal-dependent hydrolase (beta-lactamase superfamily II)